MSMTVAEIRERAPIAIPGRRKTAEKHRRAQERQAAEAPAAPDEVAETDREIAPS